MRFAYCDPPYLGQGKKKYGHPEWDKKETHLALIGRLLLDYPDGWVLSCNPRDTRWLLPVCPEEAREGIWAKNYHQIRPTTVQFAFEKVIFIGGRKDNKRKPMVRDWIMAPATRMKGVPGYKSSIISKLGLKFRRSNTQSLNAGGFAPGGLQAAVERLQVRKDEGEG